MYSKAVSSVAKMLLSSAQAHILLSLLPLVLSGPNDTVDQLRQGFTIVPLADQVTHAEVSIKLPLIFS